MPIPVHAEISGNVWKIEVKVGDEVADGARVNEGDTIMIMESMKMEIPVEAPASGTCRLSVSEGQNVQEGDLLAHVE